MHDHQSEDQAEQCCRLEHDAACRTVQASYGMTTAERCLAEDLMSSATLIPYFRA